MAFRHFLIIFGLVIISSCAEVGTISGGPKDEIPPRITKSTLQNGTTNFNENKVEITFDEFIQLNKPNENIILVPSHARIESQLIKKTLRIDFSESLQKNTTYTLYLNAAVKDVTEGNDSLMQFTFSTGPKLDSLKFHARIKDAFTNQLKPKVTVGLYDSLNSEKPIYFGQTDQNGIANLNALKEGTYYCKVFEDKNKDLLIQKDEPQDWLFDSVYVGPESNDTLSFSISIPRQADKIKNAKIIPPGLIGVHIPKDVILNEIKINGAERSSNEYWNVKNDSLHISLGNITENEIQFILNSDTFNLRRMEKNKMAKLTPKLISNEEEFSTSSSFEISDLIQEIDSSKLDVIELPDSSKLAFKISFEKNKLTIMPTDGKVRNYIVTFKDGAISGKTGKKSNSTKVEVKIKEDREFGSLNVKLNKSFKMGILQLMDKEKVVIEQLLKSDDSIVNFNRINPGQYTFRIIDDSNGNGQWDPINPIKQSKAESIIYFSTSVKVRANWEVETALELN